MVGGSKCVVVVRVLVHTSTSIAALIYYSNEGI